MMESLSELRNRIRTLVAEQLGLDVAEVDPEASILDDLGAERLGLQLKLIFAQQLVHEVAVRAAIDATNLDPRAFADIDPDAFFIEPLVGLQF